MRFPSFSAPVHAIALAQRDYARVSTLALALERIEADGIPGALAEVGVWRGDTSVLLQAARPERELFLFDTFSGFPTEQLDPGTEERSRFRDTDPETVRSRLPPDARVRIQQGRVPETFREVASERFAFVLLDLDLHEPTHASLDFFYPRLSPGGFLFVHDYNNAESGWACKRALDRFLSSRPERMLEIGDIYGTAVFRKD